MEKALNRADRERRHGQYLASGGAEDLWGWGSPAGRRRAARRAALISAAAGLAPGVRAIEIGCGTGDFTEVFAATGAQIVAVDISPDLLEIARARGLPADRVTFLCRRFEDASIPGPFDTAIGSSVLHHLEVEPALGCLCSLLKPGGRLAFAEPNMVNPQILGERTVLRRLMPHISPDETAFVRWDLARKLRRAGFQNVRITPFDWLHPAIPPAWINAVSAVGRFLEKLPVLREFSGSLLIQAQRPG
jgi:2-polyprenyl-3-methyl-5-hydroxy-6-metoxy-1,4-benzoquinol methylase